MKLYLLAAALVAIFPALAQFGSIALGSLPQCAQNCLASNIGASGGCSSSDYSCFCRSSGFINAVSCCLQNTCNSTEQKTAITFNVALCENFNVTIPNYLGCSYLQSVSYNVSSVSFPSTIVVTALASVTTVDSYIAAYVTTRDGPVASFSGPPVLTGSCTTPRFASYTEDGVVTQFPYIGCQNGGCCPFNPGNPGPLTVCPHDFYTTAGACCPSGWSLAKTALAGGLTYCATQPAELMVPATTAQGGHAVVISDMLFTLRYDLGSAVPFAGLSAGDVAGVAVGSVLGVLVTGLAGLLIYRARQRRAQKIRNATTVPAPAAAGTEHEDFSPTAKEEAPPMGLGSVMEHIVEAPASNEIPSELPSPPPLQSPGEAYYSAPSSAVESRLRYGVLASPSVPPLPPQELPGSTHMNEHHPANQPSHSQMERKADDSEYEDDLVEDGIVNPLGHGSNTKSRYDTEQHSALSTKRVSSLFDGFHAEEGQELRDSFETRSDHISNTSRGFLGSNEDSKAVGRTGQGQ